MFDFSNITTRAQLRKVSFDDIKEFCLNNGKAEWLLEAVKKNVFPNKKGEPSFNFLSFKRDFIVMMGFKFEEKKKARPVLAQLAEIEQLVKQAKTDAYVQELLNK